MLCTAEVKITLTTTMIYISTYKNEHLTQPPFTSDLNKIFPYSYDKLNPPTPFFLKFVM